MELSILKAPALGVGVANCSGKSVPRQLKISFHKLI